MLLFKKFIQFIKNRQIFLVLDENEFIYQLAKRISTNNQPIIRNIELTIAEILSLTTKAYLHEKALSKPKVKIYSTDKTKLHLSLLDFAQKGYESRYIELKFSTSLNTKFTKFNIWAKNILLAPIGFGTGKLEFYRVQHKALKTKKNYSIIINHLILRKQIFTKLLDQISAENIHSLYMANLRNLSENKKFLLPAFINKVDGREAICSCSIEARQKSGGINEKYQILNNLCHLCIAKENTKKEILSKYDESIFTNYIAYQNQIMLSKNLTAETAKTEIFLILGLTKWKSETKLYTIIKELFKEEIIIREASPSWLNRQRLDIFLPNLNLAIEYQGEQHYKPIDVFGGQNSFSANINRDQIKKEKCIENGVDLIEFKYTEPLTVDYTRNKLKKYLL